MYWQCNHQSSPQIEIVLAKEDLTLNEVLEQENLLQELKSPNIKLIEFITRSDILSELISLIIEEPSLDIEEHERYKLPNLACEVLTTDVPRVNESLLDVALLTKLYSFLEKDPPLNPLLASYFSRTLSLLICRKSDQNWYSYQFTCLSVLDFLKSKEDSLKLLLKHLGTSAIMDLTLKLITQVEGKEMQQNLYDWLESEHLVDRIIELFHHDVESDRHDNAAQLLSDTIKQFQDQDNSEKDLSKPDPILSTIQSTETVQKLLREMLEGEVHSESGIVGGITVLLTLLDLPASESPPSRRHYYNDDASSQLADANTNPAVSTIVFAILPFLPKFQDLLINPPKKPSFKLSSGEVDPPLGITRLSVIKLIAALISTKTLEVNQKLDELNTIKVLLDLFFQYTWNNFLHSQVEKCLAFALNASAAGSKEQNPIISNIFLKCRLLQRILDAWDDNEDEQGKGGKRKGYMGHLIKIANNVVEKVDGHLSEFVKENVEPDMIASWEQFVASKLLAVNQVQKQCLGGCHPMQAQPKEDTDYSVTFDSENGMMTNASLSSSTKNLAENFGGLFTMTSSADDIGLSEERKRRFEELLSQRVSGNVFGGDDDDWEAETTKTKSIADLDISLDDEEVWEQFSPSACEIGEGHGSSDEDIDKPINFKTESIWSSDPWGNQENETKDSTKDGWANFDVAFNQPPAEVEKVPSDAASVDAKDVSTDGAGELASEALQDKVDNVDNAALSVQKCRIDEQGDPSGEEQASKPNAADDTTTHLGNINENVDGTSDLPSPLDSESDNNANLKSLTEEPSQNEELFFSTPQPVSGDEASVKSGPPRDPV
ncbi:SIT4 phosphatase-associated protein [Nesidiocoris tenuis]|uniref:SIT4 phosphatase-associated protein n=1 Tax=Nesidiocoris tenuis TaxID=355587 RepID=A0ABN7B7Q7_9HEMI|nr:SIT4 phosphatase-associated protein [Nesidiocoris tenuis]